MTTTITQIINTKRAEQRTWLLAAAERLTAEGNLELAAEARTEAVELSAPWTPAPAVTVRCDNCRRPVKSTRQLAKYDLVDWALCPKCERGVNP